MNDETEINPYMVIHEVSKAYVHAQMEIRWLRCLLFAVVLFYLAVLAWCIPPTPLGARDWSDIIEQSCFLGFCGGICLWYFLRSRRQLKKFKRILAEFENLFGSQNVLKAEHHYDQCMALLEDLK